MGGDRANLVGFGLSDAHHVMVDIEKRYNVSPIIRGCVLEDTHISRPHQHPAISIDRLCQNDPRATTFSIDFFFNANGLYFRRRPVGDGIFVIANVHEIIRRYGPNLGRRGPS